MKANQDLRAQLNKLKQLAPAPLDLSFLLGYFAYGLQSTSLPPIRTPLQNLLSLCMDGLITPVNVLQLLTIVRYKLLTEDPKEGSRKLVDAIDSYVGELALDNGYLQNKYFVEKEPEKDLGLGECPICVQTIDYSSLCFLSCGHMFHKNCFNSYADIKIADKIFPMLCPLQSCLSEISTSELSQFLSPPLLNKYTQFTFQQYVDKHLEDTSWCPTPGCKAVFAFDAALTNYRCPACKKHYCLRCKCEMHVGVSCQEYQSMAEMNEDDRRFMVLVKGAKYKQCPSCRFWVEKNEGCDHMTCRCKYEFCYICGGKYGSCACNGQHERNVDISDDDSDQIIRSVRSFRLNPRPGFVPLREIRDLDLDFQYMEPGIMPQYVIPPKLEVNPLIVEREHSIPSSFEEKQEIIKSIASDLEEREKEEMPMPLRERRGSMPQLRQQIEQSQEMMLKRAIQMSLVQEAQPEKEKQEKKEVQIQIPAVNKPVDIPPQSDIQKKLLNMQERRNLGRSRMQEIKKSLMKQGQDS